MPTELLFRHDAYLAETPATVVGLTPEGGIVLDRSVFYATAGGQPGDTGWLVGADGTETAVAGAVWSADKQDIVHLLAPDAARPAPGDTLVARLDWVPRYNRMRMHTALHLLSVALPYPVTGGSIGERESRLDFDIPDAGLDKDAVTARVNELIASDAAVTESWITDAELDANPGLVKTLSVKPPRGSGRVRLVRIGDIDAEPIDLQPCGGTHVRRLSEIGPVIVSKIEKKGQQNRRVRLTLA
ncbi:misacylated tRNA(Ala) deacylase [Ancylobacter sp. 3268]|uniref:alanyl-tRNA editing protein n=1 Tax=Ancylobacter sp. 3268 TaxID=2817752 RepID=UPI00285735E2|nr:alanyl-tRNA editing protein [Ancylobacter sp. 3268]MDR6955645.1 misacylated tRNA(Ala) deacylase [Ancylobacter sp. 3268]